MSEQVCPACLAWIAQQGHDLWDETPEDRIARLTAVHRGHSRDEKS